MPFKYHLKNLIYYKKKRLPNFLEAVFPLYENLTVMFPLYIIQYPEPS